MSEEIKKMFSGISKNYDYMNNVMSLGLHHIWRKRLVKLSGAKPGDTVLDTASGTGDLAIEFK
ncbi:MAG: class I SAM-dependent methyltransferase, partial [Ignavibacteriae bacterium]|nr:class I SAM-dependent methyltransferase [Ignavibacteriota bacterium]